MAESRAGAGVTVGGATGALAKAAAASVSNLAKVALAPAVASLFAARPAGRRLAQGVSRPLRKARAFGLVMWFERRQA